MRAMRMLVETDARIAKVAPARSGPGTRRRNVSVGFYAERSCPDYVPQR